MDKEAGQTSREKASADLAVQLKTLAALNSSMGKGKAQLQLDWNNATGRNIFREELGDFGEYDGASYHLEQNTRDTLLAHSRQDAATAVLNAGSAYREARIARKVGTACCILLLVVLTIQVYLIFQAA